MAPGELCGFARRKGKSIDPLRRFDRLSSENREISPFLPECQFRRFINPCSFLPLLRHQSRQTQTWTTILPTFQSSHISWYGYCLMRGKAAQDPVYQRLQLSNEISLDVASTAKVENSIPHIPSLTSSPFGRLKRR